jgi:mannose-6-phosphate isomerase-like protein (cupin superfamily)
MLRPMGAYTHTRLTAVEDSAPKFGFADSQESRFAKDDLDAESIGLAYHRIKPGVRQPFGHRHDDAEEVYVVLSGTGRMALDDDVIELRALDAVRVEPSVMRAFEGGPDGLEVIAFGPHHKGDGDIVPGWWSGEA